MMQLPNLRARACVHERGKVWAVTALRADEKLRARQFYKKMPFAVWHKTLDKSVLEILFLAENVEIFLEGFTADKFEIFFKKENIGIFSREFTTETTA